MDRKEAGRKGDGETVTITQLEARLNEVEGQGRAALARLQDQFDVLAGAHAEALANLAVFSTQLAETKAKVVGALPPDTAAFAKFILPTENAPARRSFNSAGLLGAIAERQRA